MCSWTLGIPFSQVGTIYTNLSSRDVSDFQGPDLPVSFGINLGIMSASIPQPGQFTFSEISVFNC